MTYLPVRFSRKSELGLQTHSYPASPLATFPRSQNRIRPGQRPNISSRSTASSLMTHLLHPQPKELSSRRERATNATSLSLLAQWSKMHPIYGGHKFTYHCLHIVYTNSVDSPSQACQLTPYTASLSHHFYPRCIQLFFFFFSTSFIDVHLLFSMLNFSVFLNVYVCSCVEQYAASCRLRGHKEFYTSHD